MKLLAVAVALSTTLMATPMAGGAEPHDDPRPRIAAQRTALAALAAFDGEWRGPATIYLDDGKTLRLTQTERFGPFLDGSVRVVEGRGHLPTGEVGFNAFGIISYSPHTKAYTLRSYAQGYAGDFPLKVIPDGFVWTIQAGPATLRYTATVRDGEWHEIGERVLPGKAPVKTFEMRLRRIGDSSWPAGSAVRP